jgi:hypothetical protein
VKTSSIKIFALCAIAVCVNIVLGTFIAYIRIPFLYLDVIGTIFIAANFKMPYGIMTAICTSLLISIVSGPLFLPFVFVSIAIAIVTNLMARNGFGYKKALLTGLLVTLIGSLVSAPIRLIMFGGLSNSITNFLILSLKASGQKMITAAYWGAFADSIVDKTLSCLLVAWLMQLPLFQKHLQTIGN